MTIIQPGILRPIPTQASYLTFELNGSPDSQTIIRCLEAIDVENTVLGIGSSLLETMNCAIEHMATTPTFESPTITIPSTPTALWCWLQDDDRGKLLHRTRRLVDQLAPALRLLGPTEAYQYDQGRDLTGYEDGTENPEGVDAQEAAVLSSSNPDLDGSSFVAVQLWQHDLDAFAALTQLQQDHTIGRRRSDNEELDDAPESAHVKRTAQESFSPEAFMLRRSMPWSEGLKGGLQFVAFGCSFYAFEVQMKRMIGLEDNIVDGLFQFSQPLSTAYYWCPPAINNKLNLNVLG
ncbi:MAG: putative iron-dependent peroxidase [Gammaproteobacteria bacterium]|jgi:putative iron-dependent peroxidase